MIDDDLEFRPLKSGDESFLALGVRGSFYTLYGIICKRFEF
jgi:hypothetical protein